MRRKFGGRTRIRTLDPLIKSQLLYQLSYAPGSRCGDPRKPACCSKAERGCPATLPIQKKPRGGPGNKKKPPETWPGGFWRAAIIGKEECPPRPLSRARLSGRCRRGAASGSGPPRTARPCEEACEAALLAVVEALVERLDGVGELLQARARVQSSHRRPGAAARSHPTRPAAHCRHHGAPPAGAAP